MYSKDNNICIDGADHDTSVAFGSCIFAMDDYSGVCFFAVPIRKQN